jgi:hypothetical protein
MVFFDFDLAVTFHRDPKACKEFSAVSKGGYQPDIEELVFDAGRGKATVVQQFFGQPSIVAVIAGKVETISSVVDRTKESTWSKAFGLGTIVAAVTATILLLVHITDVGIAGYAVAVLTLLAAVAPLVRK